MHSVESGSITWEKTNSIGFGVWAHSLYVNLYKDELSVKGVLEYYPALRHLDNIIIQVYRAITPHRNQAL